jgi:hypothetical protein
MFKPMYAPPNYTTPARQKVIQAMQARRGIGAPQMPAYNNPYQFTGGVTVPASPEPMPSAPPMPMQAPPMMTPQAPSMQAMPNEMPPQAKTPLPQPAFGGMKSSPVEQPGAPINQPAPAQPSTVKMQRFSGGPINYGT